MDDHVYKAVEITGSSRNSIDDAIRVAVARASATIRHICWFEVIATRGSIENGAVAHFQVTLKINFRLDDATVISGITDSWIDDAAELAPERAAEGLIVPATVSDGLIGRELVNKAVQ